MLLLLSRVVLVLEQAAVESMRTPASAPIRSTVADLICLPPPREVVDRFLLLILLAPLPSNARWAFPQEYARIWETIEGAIGAPRRVEVTAIQRIAPGRRGILCAHCASLRKSHGRGAAVTARGVRGGRAIAQLLAGHDGRPTLEK
jgi:hypothetical protein